MRDLITRMERLETILLDQANGNEGHPSYYSAEVVHRAIERIEGLELRDREWQAMTGEPVPPPLPPGEQK